MAKTKDSAYRLLRNLMGLGAGPMAKLCGISAPYWNELERGKKTNPSKDVIDRVAAAAGLPADTIKWLIGLGPDGIAQVRQAMIQSLDGFAAYAKRRDGP